MTNPCEKEQIEYDQAIKEEIEAKDRVNSQLKPLGIKTPPPSDPNAINYWLEKEKIKNEKLQALEDCKKTRGFSL